MVDDLSSNDYIRRLVDRVRRLEAALSLESASISEGGLRVISSDPGLRVEGLLTVTGTFVLSGGATITGTLAVNGPWTLAGNGDITGNVDLIGDMDVTGDINVTGGGRVKVGSNMVLNPASSGGAIEFGSSDIVESGGALVISRGSYSVALQPSGIQITAAGFTISLTSSGIRLSGIPTVSGSGLPTNALFVDESGYIQKAL